MSLNSNNIRANGTVISSFMPGRPIINGNNINTNNGSFRNAILRNIGNRSTPFNNNVLTNESTPFQTLLARRQGIPSNTLYRTGNNIPVFANGVPYYTNVVDSGPYFPLENELYRVPQSETLSPYPYNRYPYNNRYNYNNTLFQSNVGAFPFGARYNNLYYGNPYLGYEYPVAAPECAPHLNCALNGRSVNDCRSCVIAQGGSGHCATQICGPHN